MSGEELQKARKTAEARYTVIALFHKPADWTVNYTSRQGFTLHPANRTIEVPRPISRKALYLNLAAMARAMQHDASPDNEAPKDHRAFAIEVMRRHGIAVPRQLPRN